MIFAFVGAEIVTIAAAESEEPEEAVAGAVRSVVYRVLVFYVAHTLANHSDAPARYVLVCTPAGFERHWARMAADAAGVEPPPWALQPIPKVNVVGPPIAMG